MLKRQLAKEYLWFVGTIAGVALFMFYRVNVDHCSADMNAGDFMATGLIYLSVLAIRVLIWSIKTLRSKP
jgi:hypothetical protein